MRLLFDQNLSFKLPDRLADICPGSTQVRLIGMAEASDADIWRRAAVDGFMLVSLDSDFAEMAAVRGSPPKVVWLRCGNQPTRVVEALRRALPDLRTFDADPAVACLQIY